MAEVTPSTTSSSVDTFPPASLAEAAKEVAQLLKDHGSTISVAETAAGGLISASLLSVPGSSTFYKGGLTLYTLESRLMYAGWTPSTISTYAGPTPEIVSGLASHIRSQFHTTYTIGESGTAGPTGGQTRNRKPGYCALAVSFERNGKADVVTKEIETGLGGERTGNMVAFAKAALELVRDVILAGQEGEGGRL